MAKCSVLSLGDFTNYFVCLDSTVSIQIRYCWKFDKWSYIHFYNNVYNRFFCPQTQLFVIYCINNIWWEFTSFTSAFCVRYCYTLFCYHPQWSTVIAWSTRPILTEQVSNKIDEISAKLWMSLNMLLGETIWWISYDWYS